MARDRARRQVGLLEELGGEVEAQLLAYAEHTTDLVGVVDEQSQVLYLNPAARKRRGIGEGVPLTSGDIFPPQVFSRYYDEIRPTLLRAGTWTGELQMLTASGEVVPVLCTVVAQIGTGGEVTGLVTHGR